MGASGEASLGSTNSATGSFSTESKTPSTSSSPSPTENKDLSATSERPSSRVYSTNSTDASSSRSSQSSSGSDSFNLRIQGTTDADQKLADQVRQELRSNTALMGSMSRLRISLENGKATLRGTVKTDEEKQKIEQSIQKVTGVTSVQNELRVSATAGANETNESK